MPPGVFHSLGQIQLHFGCSFRIFNNMSQAKQSPPTGMTGRGLPECGWAAPGLAGGHDRPNATSAELSKEGKHVTKTAAQHWLCKPHLPT